MAAYAITCEVSSVKWHNFSFYCVSCVMFSPVKYTPRKDQTTKTHRNKIAFTSSYIQRN
jgi:hypothetical protein